MKLSSKLLIAFMISTILAVLVAAVSWYSMQRMATQEGIVDAADESLIDVYVAQLNFVEGIGDRDISKIQTSLEALALIKEPLKYVAENASSKEVHDAVNSVETRYAEIPPLVNQLIKDMNAFNSNRQLIRDQGNSLEAQLNDLLASQASVYNNTLDPNIANFNFELSQVIFGLGQVRQFYRDFVIYADKSTTDILLNAWKQTKKEIDDLQQYSSSIDRSVLSNLFSMANQYEATMNETIANSNKLIEPSAKALQLANELIEAGQTISDIAATRFNEAHSTALMLLLIVLIIALIVGIALALGVTKNIVGQLGTDPGVLVQVAERVSAGDYDIDDGKPHQGVYNEIINMVAEMKKTLDFSSGILKELPVPCAVFGTDNRLQFVNQRMLSLLELDNDPEKYLGQTSGMFMFRQEDYMTASRRCIAEKQGSNLRVPYTTAKNNSKHVNGIAAPIINRDGVLTNVISIWLDVTEETLNNKRIEEANANMQDVARELQQVATVASSTTLSLSETINQSGQGAQDQAERVSVTATALEEMNATVLEVARSAGTTSDSAASVKSEANSGSESMQVCVRAMHNVREESLKLKEEMNTLSSHAQAINEIMNVISDIADQTNLLALNAAIEAARAGDAGRGFAVVADEVRNLAEKTMTSTTDVGNAIAAIQKSTADNTRLVDGTVEKIENAAEMVAQVGEALLGIVDLADSTADQISSIATASEEQSSTSEEITRSIEEVNNIATANAASMGDAALAVGELVNQTQILADLVDRLHGSDNN